MHDSVGKLDDLQGIFDVCVSVPQIAVAVFLDISKIGIVFIAGPR
jgi:hypothetical protein